MTIGFNAHSFWFMWNNILRHVSCLDFCTFLRLSTYVLLEKDLQNGTTLPGCSAQNKFNLYLYLHMKCSFLESSSHTDLWEQSILWWRKAWSWNQRNWHVFWWYKNLRRVLFWHFQRRAYRKKKWWCWID